MLKLDMLKKILLISLVCLAPMQSWAAVQMPFQHVPTIEIVEVTQHPCHQEMVSSSSEEDISSAHSNNCNACTLCMTFGFFVSNYSSYQERFSVSFRTTEISFESQDVLTLIKPPIL